MNILEALTGTTCAVCPCVTDGLRVYCTEAEETQGWVAAVRRGPTHQTEGARSCQASSQNNRHFMHDSTKAMPKSEGTHNTS
jgi:hypothetical protein